MAEFGKLNFSVSFNPTSAFPLDARSYFESLTQATAAAATADVAGSSTTTYYYGQTVVVVENSVATLYIIQPDKTLKEVGSVPVGDGKSITVEDGKIKIVGFDTAEVGAQPRKKADGTVEWVKPDTTTVEGLQTLVSGLESDVETLQTGKADASSVYTKTEIDGKLSGVYHYKGSVAKYSDLPTDASSGDVYNIEAADKTNGIKAGDNVAWNGTAWDVLAGTIDLSGYATTTALDGKVDKVEGSRLMTNAEGTKLEGIAAGAQVNAIDSVDTAQFSLGDAKKLTLLDIAMAKVTGLTDALAGKVDKVEGSRLITDAEGTKLAGIESGAQANTIENVKVGGVALAISEKSVNIPTAGESLGAVKSATGTNNVTVDADGIMTVNKLDVNNLVQESEDTLILNGGSSAN
jgi:hypothetical protein